MSKIERRGFFYFYEMESTKIDRTKLVTPKSYSEIIGVTVQHVYNLMKGREVKVVVIDGVKFIHL